MKKNNIKITRLPGKSLICTGTIKFKFDVTDPAAVERFACALRELIPEEERAQFLADFQAAAAKASPKTQREPTPPE